MVKRKFMKKITHKKLARKLRDIEERLLLISSLMEVVKDSCIQKGYENHEIVLEMALKKQYAIIETISMMY